MRRLLAGMLLTCVVWSAGMAASANGPVSRVVADTEVMAQSQPPTGPPPGMPPGGRPGFPGGPPPGMGPGGRPGMPPGMAPPDSFIAERDSMMNALLKQIAGRENAPAESVFKNIKSMTGMPAGRLLRIMNMGYGRSLGVRCAHCHVPDKWDAEDKPQKQIAREMGEMMKAINSEMLPKIKGLRSERPGVNCTTCHRGAIKPAMM